MSVHLHSFIDAKNRGSIYTSLPNDELILNFSECARDAVAFDVGDIESLADSGVGFNADLFRLPYEVVWIEGFAPTTKTTVGMLCTSTRVTPDSFKKKNALFAAAYISSGAKRRWHASVFGLLVATPGESSLEVDFEGLSGQRDPAERYVHQRSAMVACLTNFLMAVNCVNVEQRLHRPSRFKQQRQKAKKQSPLHSYWTLHIKKSLKNPGCNGVGTHASPRVHLRRGHIRQYSPGKFTWVQPCVVRGQSPGIVEKDYAL